MRFFIALCLGFACASSNALAQAPAPDSTPIPAPSPEIEAIAPDSLLPPQEAAPGINPLTATQLSRAERLDTLFQELKREPNRARADRIARQIQTVWNDSGSATVDLLLLWSEQAVADNKIAAALDLVEQSTVLQPENPEIWNRRAILNYQSGKFGLAIADVTQVLAREPRHFPALMGLGAMLEELGRRREALDAYQQVLSVYPTQKDAQDAVARIADELAGNPA